MPTLTQARNSRRWGGAIQADHEALIPEAGQADTPPAVREEVRFGETTLGVELPPTLPEVETLGAGPETPIPVTGPATISPPSIEDELSLFMRELDARFGRYVQAVRAQERTRYEVLLQTHAARLQKLAENSYAANSRPSVPAIRRPMRTRRVVCVSATST